MCVPGVECREYSPALLHRNEKIMLLGGGVFFIFFESAVSGLHIFPTVHTFPQPNFEIKGEKIKS